MVFKFDYASNVSEFLFTYGTLQKPEVQLRLFDRTLVGFPDRLKGYAIVPIKITDKRFLEMGLGDVQKTITPSANAEEVIEGSILELTEKELMKADQYEPDNYRRIRLRFESGRQAWVYVAGDVL